MKKFLTMGLALIMVLSMSVTAFADGNEKITNEKDGVVGEFNGQSQNIDAIGRYDKNGDGKVDDKDETNEDIDVIAVDLKWSAMEWIYTAAGSYDPDDMVTVTTGHWNQKTNTIEVSNRSNVGITVATAFDVDDGGLEGAALLFNATKIGTVHDEGTDLEGSWVSEENTLTLKAATEKINEDNPGDPANATIDVTLNLEGEGNMAAVTIDKDNVKLGTITLTIAKVLTNN